MPEKVARKFVRMRSVQRESIDEEFTVNNNEIVPPVPLHGARVKVCYAGACYTEGQVERSRQTRLRSFGVRDTSLFPGYEVSGAVDEVCHTIRDTCQFHPGDHVIVYPDSQEIVDTGYAEYIIVRDVRNLIHVPDTLPLDVAALLPCGALRAYSAVLRAQSCVKYRLDNKQDQCHVLVVGAGGLGLWTLKMAEYLMRERRDQQSKVHIIAVDSCVEQLMVAKKQGNVDVVHWDDSVHEEHIIERTRDVCPDGIDVVIDFVSSPRTISRAQKLLRQDGVLLVGGNTKYEMKLSVHSLAQNNNSILGVNNGTREQLQQLVALFAQQKMAAPCYSVFPVVDANEVFEKLNQSQIHGRAVLQIATDQ